jgi:hypothetical protein
VGRAGVWGGARMKWPPNGVKDLQRAEGPWWKSWLAVFGRKNGLDRIALVIGVERERRWIFWEGNASLRARCDEVASPKTQVQAAHYWTGALR